MGAWGADISENDTFAEIYESYFDLYNSGATAEVATQRIRVEFAEAFVEYDDKYDATFALADAQWETNALEPALLKQVREMITSGAALNNWVERDGAPEERRAALAAFLARLSQPNPAPRRRP